MDASKRAPLLILLKGHPCSGKSTFGKQLAEILQCPLIDKDDAKSALYDALSSSVDDAKLNSTSYQIVQRLIQRQLELGLNCIVDTPLASRSLFDAFSQLAEKVALSKTLFLRLMTVAQCGGQLALIECIAKDSVLWRSRVEERARELQGTSDHHKAFSWTQLQHLIHQYHDSWKWSEDTTELNLAYYRVIDTTSTLSIAILKDVSRELKLLLHQ